VCSAMTQGRSGETHHNSWGGTCGVLSQFADLSTAESEVCTDDMRGVKLELNQIRREIRGLQDAFFRFQQQCISQLDAVHGRRGITVPFPEPKIAETFVSKGSPWSNSEPLRARSPSNVSPYLDVDGPRVSPQSDSSPVEDKAPVQGGGGPVLMGRVPSRGGPETKARPGFDTDPGELVPVSAPVPKTKSRRHIEGHTPSALKLPFPGVDDERPNLSEPMPRDRPPSMHLPDRTGTSMEPTKKWTSDGGLVLPFPEVKDTPDLDAEGASYQRYRGRR